MKTHLFPNFAPGICLFFALMRKASELIFKNSAASFNVIVCMSAVTYSLELGIARQEPSPNP